MERTVPDPCCQDFEYSQTSAPTANEGAYFSALLPPSMAAATFLAPPCASEFYATADPVYENLPAAETSSSDPLSSENYAETGVQFNGHLRSFPKFVPAISRSSLALKWIQSLSLNLTLNH